jgi:hypothetical protein
MLGASDVRCGYEVSTMAAGGRGGRVVAYECLASPRLCAAVAYQVVVGVG